MRRLSFAILSLALIVTAIPNFSATPVPDPITEWGATAQTVAAASGMAPFRTPITLAILHVAMYDVVVAITGGSRPYAVSIRPTQSASALAASVEAGYRVLLFEFPTQQRALGVVYDRLRAAIPDSQEKTSGAAIGATVAQSLISIRANDGRNANVPYNPGNGPGVWVPTPPAFLPATTAFLARTTPFTMDSPSQFRPSGPPRLHSGRWFHDYDEVKTLGAKNSPARTPEQTATAVFWQLFAGTVWPASIQRLAKEQDLDLLSSARFQAAAFAAFADGLIACWDAKFYFNFWRPVTAIQNGETDKNQRTAADPYWEPLAITPNFPEYPSGHTCVTAAVAYTIEYMLPRDVHIPARNIVTGDERFYSRAVDVVDEVIEARMMLGVHFRSADEDGADIGRKIANQIRSRWFKRKGNW